jgi:hypothetical protein
MFKALVLQTLYTLSDEQTEYQLKDRLWFMRFPESVDFLFPVHSIPAKSKGGPPE